MLVEFGFIVLERYFHFFRVVESDFMTISAEEEYVFKGALWLILKFVT